MSLNDTAHLDSKLAGYIRLLATSPAGSEGPRLSVCPVLSSVLANTGRPELRARLLATVEDGAQESGQAPCYERLPVAAYHIWVAQNGRRRLFQYSVVVRRGDHSRLTESVQSAG